MSLIFPDGSRTVPLGTARPTRQPPGTVGAGTETELPGMDGEWVRMPDGSYQPAGQPRPPRRPQPSTAGISGSPSVRDMALLPGRDFDLNTGEILDNGRPTGQYPPPAGTSPRGGTPIRASKAPSQAAMQAPRRDGVFTPIPSAGGMPPADPTRMTPLQLERYHQAWMQDYERRMAEWKLQQMMKEAETGDQIGKPAPDDDPDLRQLIQDVRKSQATAQQSVAPDEQRPWKVENGRVVFMDTPEYERRSARRDSQRASQEDAAYERRMNSEAANRRNQKESALAHERIKNRHTGKAGPLEREARREASERQERLRAERAKMTKPGDAQPIMPQDQGTPYGEPGGDPRVMDYYFSLVASGEGLGMAEAKAKQMARTLGVQFGQ
jgi:hypothetical protein